MIAAISRWPLAVRILAGLALGLTIGLALPVPGSSAAVDKVVEGAGLVGDLWLSALKMTILPLVFALLATTFTRTRSLGVGGRIARRTIIAVFLLYGLAILVGAAITPVMFGLAPISPAASAALRSMGGGVVATPLPLSEMVLSLVPTNIIAAMAGPSLLPVLLFALLFGAALTKVKNDDHRQPLVNGLSGLADAMFILVGWIIALAPFGIALLSVRTVHLYGADIVFGLAHYLALIVIGLLILTFVVYLIAIFILRLPPITFARALLPTQAVAFGTQSSLACLPLILKSCDDLGIRQATSAVSAPIAVTLMRMTAPLTHVVATAYAAAVYGIPFGIAAMVIAGLVGMLLEIGSAGIPSTATFVALRAPVFALFGIPLEIIAVFLVVETIPDMFKTLCNVTGDVTAVAWVDRGLPASEPKPA
ncbi:MAG TPA: cation:dicarboxylase symporter family transporter [Sphingomicrobium sp.]|nr:cation:dicarboxylase symporter family transporter [Sphingomicrobium sp.]